MSEIFNGEWWTVRLPAGWDAVPEEHGASFFRAPRIGTLQLSSARKSTGEVSEDDLKEFAAGRLTAGHELQKIRYDAFSGFHCVRFDASFCWNEWWLKHGSLMIYATYVVPTTQTSDSEMREAVTILESLAAR